MIGPRKWPSWQRRDREHQKKKQINMPENTPAEVSALTICLGGGRPLFAYRAPPPPVLNRLGLQHESTKGCTSPRQSAHDKSDGLVWAWPRGCKVLKPPERDYSG